MIPKVIHYCWFGGNPLPDSVENCIVSWREHCPGYEIKRWDESNYDVRKIAYMKEAYEAKKYAFVSDVARLDIVHEHGGIYLDTDVELIKPLDSLLRFPAYIGLESAGRAATGLGFGAEAGNNFIKENLERYKTEHFSSDGKFNTTTCVTYTTELLFKRGLKKIDKEQDLGDVVILPTDILCPFNLETKKTNITKHTISIHHYDATWKDEKDRFLSLKMKVRRWLGDERYELLKNRMRK